MQRLRGTKASGTLQAFLYLAALTTALNSQDSPHRIQVMLQFTKNNKS